MEGNPLRNKERIDIEIRIATPEDWEAYRNLRLSLSKEDAAMLGISKYRASVEKIMSEEEWRESLLASESKFTSIVFTNHELVGASYAEERATEKGVWHIGAAYVKPAFRGMKIDQRRLATVLDEIIKRGGKKVMAEVKKINNPKIHIVEKFGFKKTGEIEYEGSKIEMIELDLTDPRVAPKIKEILNT